MITYNELKEKCTCWKGYKRVPGTKPCAEDSCMKEEKDAGGHGSEKHHVMAFGRMNPITSGHEAVVNKVHEVAKKNNASHGVVVSHSQDAKKNPLTGEQKVTHAKNAFPGTNVSSASKDKPTILHHAAAAHASGAQHLHVVAGSDRHEEMHNLLHKYNGKDSAHGHYNFKSITVHSSGERDPDSEGTTGISASKMREHAASGNKEAFHAGAPAKMKPEHKDAMYHDVRKGMNIKEETTPYWKKPSFNKRMSALAKQERLAREKKEAEKKPVKEETLDQQDDHAKQLKRFKDQLTKSNGPTIETETELDKIEKDLMLGKQAHGLMHHPDPSIESHVRVGKIKQMSEELHPNMGAGVYIDDFIKSTNPKFNNKSKEERRKMAIGAYMAAKAKLKEETLSENHVEFRIDHRDEPTGDVKKTMTDHEATVSDESDKATYVKVPKHKANSFKSAMKGHGCSAELCEGRGTADKHWDIAQNHKEKATRSESKPEEFHHHMSNYHDSMSSYQTELGRHNIADSHAEKAEIHHEKSLKAAGIKEGTMQSNGTDQIETSTSAPTASTAKDTTMGTKVKGFKFFKGEVDKPIKEDIALDEKLTVGGGAPVKGPNGVVSNTPAKKPTTPVTPTPAAPSRTQSALERVRARMDASKSVKEEKDPPILTARHSASDKAALARQRASFTYPNTDLPPSHPQSAESVAKREADAKKSVKEEAEPIDEKSEQAKQNKTMKNMMDASRGARFKVQNKLTGDAVRDWDGKHKTAQAQNKAIGRALRNEESLDEVTTGNPGYGYHGQHQTTHDADSAYKKIHAHVKSLTDGDDKTVKHYLDSAHGRHLVGHEQDHEYVKKDFKKFTKHYRPEMHEAAPVNVDKVNHAGDAPHEEKWETAPKKITKLKKEETMKTYKEFVEDYLLEYESDSSGVYRHTKKATYGTSYQDPEGADETAADMKKKEKKAAGRKTGQSTGSYKPRATMSKLKQAGATYK